MKRRLRPVSCRALLALAVLVLAGHWVVLAGLPLGAGSDPARSRPPALAFDTRLLAPPPPPPPPAPSPSPAAATPAPRAAPAPAPAPRPARPPRPPVAQAAPRPAPPPAPATQDRTDPAAQHPAAPSADAPPDSAGAAVVDPFGDDVALNTSGMEVAASGAGPAPAPAEPPASPAPPASSAPAEPAAPAAVEPPAPATPAAEGTGVEVRLPGAGSAPSSGALPPVTLPASARLTFEVQGQARRLQYRANAELVWHQDGARYRARQEIRAFLLGSRSQTSTGRITAHGLQPERFGDKSRSERAAHFDFERHQATFSANVPPAPLHDGAQDRLSVFIQLGAMLAAAPERYPPGTQITLTTVGARGADRWAFTVEGPEQLDLPAGPMAALKLQRVPRQDRDYDQKAELWLAPALGYLPVRIRITQANGDYADLLLDGHDDAP